MPYISQDGELKFVTQAEFDAYNKANGLPTSAMIRGETGAYTTTPAGGNVTNVTTASGTLTNAQKRALVLEQEKQNDAELADVDSKLAQASTGRITLSSNEIATLEARKSQLADNANILASGQPVTDGSLTSGTVSQTILTTNTTNTAPDQPLPSTTEQVSNSTTASSFDPQFGPAETTAVPASQVQESPAPSDNNFYYNNQGDLVPADSVYAEAPAQETVYPAADPEPPASEIENIPKPVPSSALADLQAASNTQDIANFGTTSVPVNLESDAVLAARNSSGTDTSDFLGSPKPVIGDGVVDAQLASGTDSTAFTTGNNFGTSAGDPAAIAAHNLAQQARLQQTISQQRQNQNNADWRVKLRLAPQADYLYKDANPGILQPLQVTDGVIFPYTPTIDTAYRANYDPYDPTHSNYRGYFYKNSYVEGLNLRCLFTAQSTAEANYLLATIHFFRSVTKMFYGQDPAHRGSPPPIVYLTGLGEYQFKEHSCVVSQFNYSLPADVDYIRARSTPNNNTNLEGFRRRQTTMAGGLLGGLLGGAIDRLKNAGGKKGGIFQPPAPPTLGQDSPTYVPTKMEISLTLLPIQSRAQVSQQFSLKQFGSGDLLKGGFW